MNTLIFIPNNKSRWKEDKTMKTKSKALITVGIILIGVIAIVGILGSKIFASFREVNDEKSISSEEINEIQVNMTKEHICIKQEDTLGKVRFHLYGKSKQDIKLTSEIDNNSVVIAAKCENNPVPRNVDPTPEDLYLEIYIPNDFDKNIAISATSGNLVAGQLNAKDIILNTSSGNISIDSLNAMELKITGKSSEICINECITEKAGIETTSGSIIMKKASGSLNLKTSSGKVQVSCKKLEGQVFNIATSSGAITLQLPDTAEFMLDATTSSGKLKSDFNVNTDCKKMMGQVGTKNNKVILKSSSGSISLLKAN